jgi:hypothetical protein
VIDDDVEIGRADNQVDAIAIDIDQQLTTGSLESSVATAADLFRRVMQTRLRVGQCAVVIGRSDPASAITPARISVRSKNPVRPVPIWRSGCWGYLDVKCRN